MENLPKLEEKARWGLSKLSVTTISLGETRSCHWKLFCIHSSICYCSFFSLHFLFRKLDSIFSKSLISDIVMHRDLGYLDSQSFLWLLRKVNIYSYSYRYKIYLYKIYVYLSMYLSSILSIYRLPLIMFIS